MSDIDLSVGTEYDEGLQRVTGDLTAMEELLPDLAAAFAEASQGIVRMGDDLAAVNERNEAFERSLKNFSNVQREVKAGFDDVGNGVERLKEIYNATVGETIAYAKESHDLSLSLGLTVEETQRLIQVADDYGISQQQVTNALEMAVKRGFQPSIENLSALADEINQIQDPTERAARYADIFGRNWAVLNPMLSDGGEAMRENADAAQRMGLVMSSQAVAGAEALRRGVDDLEDSVTALKYQFAQAVIPTLTNVTSNMKNRATAFDDNAEAVGRLKAVEWTLAYDAWPWEIEQLRYLRAELTQRIQLMKDLGLTTEESGVRAAMRHVTALREQSAAVIAAGQAQSTYIQDLMGTQQAADDYERAVRIMKEQDREAAEAKREQERATKAFNDRLAEITIANSRFAESFKDFSAVEGAKQTIADLEEQIKADPANRDNYAAQIRALKMEFGLITPAMELSANTFSTLETLWRSGDISTASYATALGKIKQAAADGTVSVGELGLRTDEAAKFMTASTQTASTTTDGLVADDRTKKERLMDEMGNALAGQQTKLQGRISDSMLSISNSMTAADRLSNTIITAINKRWDSVPDDVYTTYHIRTDGEVPSGASAAGSPAGSAAGQNMSSQTTRPLAVTAPRSVSSQAQTIINVTVTAGPINSAVDVTSLAYAVATEIQARQ